MLAKHRPPPLAAFIAGFLVHGLIAPFPFKIADTYLIGNGAKIVKIPGPFLRVQYTGAEA